MNIKKLAILATVAVFATLAGASQRAAHGQTCELDRTIVFAGLDWDSNRFHTEVAGFVLKHGYGCDTDTIPGSTIPLLTGMARGDIDVTMEIWKDNVTAAWTKAETAGQVRDLGTNFPDAVQGWLVPRYLVEGDGKRGIKAVAPGLKRVTDLPAHKALFRDPEEPSKGRFYNCILGWNCEDVNTRKLEAYGLLDHFTNFRPGSGAALSAVIASNYLRGKPFVAYYWGPTWVLGKFDLVMLEETPYNEKDWLAMHQDKDPNAPPVAYPVVEVNVGVNAKFAEQAPALVRFLTNYETSNALVSEALAFMQEKEDSTPKDAALQFLRTNEDLWSGWVPAAVAARVKAALATS